MTTIMPEGEEIRNAVKWVSEMRKDEPQTSIGKLIERACINFDLSPLEAEFLTRFYNNEK